MSEAQVDQREELLKNLYFNLSSPGSFGGAKRLFAAAKEQDPSIDYNFVKQWLLNQDTYRNFRLRRKKFDRLPVLVDRIDEQWQADLMDMTYWSKQNDGFVHLLVVIDILSRFAWVQPCKDKSASTIINAFSEILASGRKPEKLQTDQGREFANVRFRNFCSSNGIHFFTTTDATIKCALAECLIRTLRSRIYRFIYWKHTQRYIDNLQEIVENYNNSYHRTIKRAPNSVTQDNQDSVLQTIQRGIKTNEDRKQIFRDDDLVKIPLNSGNFEKDAVQKWTDEVFKVSSVKETPQKFIYKLQDLKGQDISSIFYPEELQKVKYDQNKTFKIEKIVKRVYDRSQRQYKYLVKWEGWPRKFNSWISDISLANDNN
uniref:Integrase catalytic domain-containing protein n=1 Tax=Tetranychus urticae TaxID=32264 RepID=A0A158P4L6_TETUR